MVPPLYQEINRNFLENFRSGNFPEPAANNLIYRGNIEPMHDCEKPSPPPVKHENDENYITIVIDKNKGIYTRK